MSDDDNMPNRGAADWESLLSRPEVDHVEVVEDVVRVRLKSGVELEWALTGLEGLP
ncbi:hypothetical protein [Leifsonia xyli]|uniref:hypothetical protein n=1 Tax=Leifsonia xyli TaxID=1575 RepID=UPI000B14F32A